MTLAFSIQPLAFPYSCRHWHDPGRTMKPSRADLPDDADGAFNATRLVLLLGLLMCVSFPDIVLGSHAFVYRDAGLFSYPLAYYSRHCIQQGELPLWNPYSNCGIPFLAQWNTMVLYPFSLFYLLLPMPWSLNYFLLGHVFLAGTGMYFLAYRWFGNRFAAMLAGLVFAWNGSSLDILMWPANTAAVGWMPWVVLLCEKAVAQGGRAIFLAALAGACQMMSGSPETILCTWFIALPVCAAVAQASKSAVSQASKPAPVTTSHDTPIWKSAIQQVWKPALLNALKMGLRFAAVIGWVAAVSAAQLAPWLDFVAHGDRSSGFGGALWSLPVWGVANFVVPLFRDSASLQGTLYQPGQEFYSSYYVGILTVALVLVALMKGRDRRTILLAILALGGLLWACGDAGYVLPLLKKIAPWLGFSRYPVKFLVITLFCLPLLAASGVAWLQAQAEGTARRALLLAGAITALAVVCVLVVSWRFPFPGEQWNVTWRSGWTRLAILLAAVVILFRQRSIARPASRWLPGFGLLLLMGADICTHAPRQNPTAPIQAYDHITPPMSSLPRLGQSRAMLSTQVNEWMNHLANPSPLELYLGQRMELFENCNLLELIPKVDGFFPVYLRWQDRVALLLSGQDYPPNLAEFLGVSQVTSSKRMFTWEAQSHFMPMATIGQQPVFLDDAATLQALASTEFRPRDVVYLPIGARASVSATADPAAKILSGKVSASFCQFEIEASRPTMLVVAQTWYHCWVAKVDGRAAPLLRANYAFQSLPVPAGRHEVRLAYKDTLFHMGAILSMLSLVLCAGCLTLLRHGRFGDGGNLWQMPNPHLPYPENDCNMFSCKRQVSLNSRQTNAWSWPDDWSKAW